MISLVRPCLAVGIFGGLLLLSAGCKCGKSRRPRRHVGLERHQAARAWQRPAGHLETILLQELAGPRRNVLSELQRRGLCGQELPATVSDFYLDKYEVTVGRFRKFVNAGMGTQKSVPAEGAGAHPKIAGSGWNSTWNTNLAADTDSAENRQKCFASYQSWTDAPGATKASR